jgi:hypothetical protein
MVNEQSTPIQRLKAEFKNWPQFPKEVHDWIIRAIEVGVQSDFLQKIQKSPADTIADLNAFFRLMRQILNTDNKSIMQGTDFDSADLDPERFDAMIAELRSVGFLHDEKFTGVRLLPQTRKQRGADILAFYGRTQYAIEVACSSRNAYRYPDHKRRSSDLVDWIINKFHEKEEQLRQTAKKEGSSRLALIVVLNSWPALPALTPVDYHSLLEVAWDSLNQPQDVHLAIVTGMVGLGHGDCIFPLWMI